MGKLAYKRHNKNRRKFYIMLIILITSIVFLYTINNLKTSRNIVIEGISIKENNNTSQVTIDNSEEVLLNHGKGFVLRNSTNNSIDDVLAVGYYRFDWSEIEIEEGVYNWDVIDSKIEELSSRGKKFAFGIMSANSTSTRQYITPEWVFASGAEGNLKDIDYTYNGENHKKTQMIPVWTDEIFLSKLNNFIKVLGERYNGNENIAFIDIRSYGNWGEQHLGVIGGEEITSKQLKELYIKPYIEAFPDTLLVTPWGSDKYKDTYEWSVTQGVTIRRDGIFKYSNGSECLIAYGKLPTIYEYTYDYNSLKLNNLWSQKELLEYVNTGKPSYIEIFPEMYQENKEFCDMLANKIGYYFRFKQAEFTNTITRGDTNKISLKFINEGVAPLYEDCTVYIGLLDQNYNLVKKYKTGIDPHTWMPDQEKTETIDITFDDIEAGKYIISLGLFLNEDDENPTYLLGSSGKTDDKWYVFGEIQINELPEQYEIVLPNNDYYINNIHSYDVEIDIKNIHNDSKYSIERYINNSLVENIEVNKDSKEYHQSLQFNFKEGENSLKIVIKKDNEIVCEKEKTIYVYSAEEDLKNISNIAIEKYAEFEEKFGAEIANVEGLQEAIDLLKQYMLNISNIENESEDIAKQKMKEHFNLGNQILEAYKNGKLDIEYVKLSSMLDMLNDIGASYEDLVTVSSITRNPDLQGTKTVIDSAEQEINDNSDIEIVYPTKILEFSKELYEKAEYINNLEEENDIKTGLIVSYDLHAKYLADWAETFTNIYIDKYIEANPVTVTYSDMSEWTNKDVIATLNIGSDAKVTNNEGNNTYTFKENGSFSFEYERRGRTFSQEVKVENIDKILPEISNIENGKIYFESVIPNVNDEHLGKVQVTLNGQAIEGYSLGNELTEEGQYELVATDKAGNVTKVVFYIFLNDENGYQIKDNNIMNIYPETTVKEFKEAFTLLKEYVIKNVDKELTEEDNIATGNVLEDDEGKIFTLIVLGDLNQDGKLSLSDISLERKYILKMIDLSEIQKLATDVNFDNNISLTDISIMRKLVLEMK